MILPHDALLQYSLNPHCGLSRQLLYLTLLWGTTELASLPSSKLSSTSIPGDSDETAKVPHPPPFDKAVGSWGLNGLPTSFLSQLQPVLNVTGADVGTITLVLNVIFILLHAYKQLHAVFLFFVLFS